jgi:hypothetical protein
VSSANPETEDTIDKSNNGGNNIIHRSNHSGEFERI